MKVSMVSAILSLATVAMAGPASVPAELQERANAYTVEVFYNSGYGGSHQNFTIDGNECFELQPPWRGNVASAKIHGGGKCTIHRHTCYGISETWTGNNPSLRAMLKRYARGISCVD